MILFQGKMIKNKAWDVYSILYVEDKMVSKLVIRTGIGLADFCVSVTKVPFFKTYDLFKKKI